MTGAVPMTILAASCATLALAQNPTPVTPPPSLLGQPANTTTVPSSGGATINAATGQPVTNATTLEATPRGGSLTNGPGSLAGTNGPGTIGVTNVAVVPTTNSPAATRSNVTPVQLQNINRLVADLSGLGLPSRDAAEQQRSLIENLKAAPVASIRPAPEAIARLGESLAAVVPSLNLTAPQRRQLAIDLNLALNSGKLSALEAQRVIADARSLLQPSAIRNPRGVEQLLNTLNGMVSGVQAAVAHAAANVAQPTATVQSAVPPTTPAVPRSEAPVAPAPEAGHAGGSQSGQGTGGSQPQPK